MNHRQELTILEVLFMDDAGTLLCYSHAGEGLRRALTTEPVVRVNSVLRATDQSWLVIERPLTHREGSAPAPMVPGIECEICHMNCGNPR